MEPMSANSHLIAVQSAPAQPNQPALQPGNFSGEILFLVPACFLTIWAIVVFTLADGWKLVRRRNVLEAYAQKSPCRNCQFYKENPYLKCAIHPTTVLTAEAESCSDYSAQTSHMQPFK